MRGNMRAYVSDAARSRKGDAVPQPLRIYVGPLQTSGALYSMHDSSRDGKFKLCTPDTAEPVRMVFQSDDGRVFERGDLGRALEKGGVLHQVDVDELTEARTIPLEKNVVHCSIHKPEEVEGKFWPSKHQSYVFYPTENDATNVMQAELIVPIAQKYSIMSHCNVQGYERVYQIKVYKGRLVLQPMEYSDTLNPHEPDDTKLTRKVVKQALEVAEKLVEDLDPEEYRNETARRVAAMGRSGELGNRDLSGLKVSFEDLLSNALLAVGLDA